MKTNQLYKFMEVSCFARRMRSRVLFLLTVLLLFSLYFLLSACEINPHPKTTNWYTVIFDSQGGSPGGSQKIIDGGMVTRPFNPTKDGNAFDGWYKEPSCVSEWNFSVDRITADRTIYAKWIGNSYTVGFDCQGGSYVDSQNVIRGGLVTQPDDPVRANFDFGGWYTQSTCITQWNFETETIMSNRILYAKWVGNAYTVSFNCQGGSAVDNQSVVRGGLVTQPADPVRANYDFGGWFTQSTCVTRWNFATDTITGDRTLYANWIINSYTVSFNCQGGSVVNSQNIVHGGLAAQPANPTRSNYGFGGWYEEPACINQWYFARNVITGDRTLYAKWVIDAFTVSFNSQGGSVVSSQAIAYGGLVVRPDSPEKNGYSFVGWYKEAACTTVWNFLSDSITSARTLYAKWTINSYTVWFDSRGGSTIENQIVAYGGLVTKPSDPVRENYVFSGWYSQLECITAWNFAMDTVSDACVIYAKWTINTYSVSFDSQGGSAVESQIVPYGDLLMWPITPSRTGYSFGGWYTEPACATAWQFMSNTITSAMTLYAKWTINTYLVFFESCGGSAVSSQSIEHGGHVSKPSPPTLEGYVFVAWCRSQYGNYPWDFANDVITESQYLYAYWVQASNTTVEVMLTGYSDESITLGPDQIVTPGDSLSIHIVEPFDEYRWYLDGVRIAGESASNILCDASGLSYLKHSISALVRKGSFWYSKSVYFIVRR